MEFLLKIELLTKKMEFLPNIDFFPKMEFLLKIAIFTKN